MIFIVSGCNFAAYLGERINRLDAGVADASIREKERQYSISLNNTYYTRSVINTEGAHYTS